MNEREYIATVVDAFYAKARLDVMIGYHFARIADFDTHLPRIHAFWETQLLGTPTSMQVDLFGAHVPLRIKRGEVGRWMVLFGATLDEVEVGPHEALRLSWREKLERFRTAFLANPRLFP